MNQAKNILTQPGGIALAICILIPWLAWWPVSTVAPKHIFVQAPMFLVVIAILATLSAWVYKYDEWAGLLCGWQAVHVLWRPTARTWDVAEVTVLGLITIVLLRSLLKDYRKQLTYILILSGVLQGLLGIAQVFGYDLTPRDGIVAMSPVFAMGSFGNSNYFGVYQAALACIAPLWLVPFFIVTVLLSKSLIACAALVVGLWVHYRHISIPLIGIAAATAVVLQRGPAWSIGIQHRWDVWQMTLSQMDAFHLIFGYGPGSWAFEVPKMQLALGVWAHSIFIEAHNEYFQLTFESGLVALGLVVGWLAYHLPKLNTTYAGAFAALLVGCFGMFTLHIATTGSLALMIVALATNNKEEVC